MRLRRELEQHVLLFVVVAWCDVAAFADEQHVGGQVCERWEKRLHGLDPSPVESAEIFFDLPADARIKRLLQVDSEARWGVRCVIAVGWSLQGRRGLAI